MADRSWFYASEGQQRGPVAEAQLRELIASGQVASDTLVWTEGMANWQRAGEIPGLLSGSSPPIIPRSAGPLTPGGFAIGQPVSVDLGTWALFGRFLLYLVGILLVIPAPWVVTSNYRWFVERLHVPGWPSPRFAGNPGDIWYVFIILALGGYAGFSGVPYLQHVFFLLDGLLSWMIVRWFVANLSPDGSQRPFTFTGSVWAYVGWYVLSFVSFITIVGWAWVLTAWLRWTCRNVEGIHGEVTFNASGLQMLWRTLVFILAACFIIPIPWVFAWYVRWSVSQFALVEGTA